MFILPDPWNQYTYFLMDYIPTSPSGSDTRDQRNDRTDKKEVRYTKEEKILYASYEIVKKK